MDWYDNDHYTSIEIKIYYTRRSG